MEATIEAGSERRTLPVILIAAVVQGWALYALHMSLRHQTWPATEAAWLLAAYSVAAFVPVTIELLAPHFARHARNAEAWMIVAVVGVAFFYFGWHHGAHAVAQHDADRFVGREMFPLGFVLLVLWTLAMPFAQCRLASGTWRITYADLFATTWRDIILLAEAAAFTGLFWLLLFLWQQLFHMIGIDFFKELFEEPIFVYPVTSLCFGVALHLIGSVERFTAVVLEQVLSVLKWLAVVAGLILAFFTLALVFKLPHLVFQGERSISAAWLLWLIAVLVLLVNAAWRDGAVARPYPRWIAFALRLVLPLMVIVALTALYSLYVRVRTYGFTVERVWAFVVALAAATYAVGYGVAAFRRDAWLGGISKVNVVVSLGLMTIIALALTPVLSPYRIAANSQYRAALKGVSEEEHEDWRLGPFRYLRFEVGQYGLEKLKALAALTQGSNSEEIREAAHAALAQTDEWSPRLPVNGEKIVEALVIYPTGRSLDPALRDRLQADLKDAHSELASYARTAPRSGLYVDLDGDGTDEFVLLGGFAYVYRNTGSGWAGVGSASLATGLDKDEKALLDEETRALRAGDIALQPRRWRDLKVGSMIYRSSELDPTESVLTETVIKRVR